MKRIRGTLKRSIYPFSGSLYRDNLPFNRALHQRKIMSRSQPTTEVFTSRSGAAIALTFKRTTTTADGKTLHDINHDSDVLYRPAGDAKFYACEGSRVRVRQAEAGDYQARFLERRPSYLTKDIHPQSQCHSVRGGGIS